MNRALQWLPAVVWMAVIFYMSHQTGDDLGSFLPLFQKWFPAMESFDWGHFLAYFILALTYYWALLPKAYSFKGKAAVIVLCVVYGITDEFHQRFVEGRTPDFMDLRNDAIGAFIAMLIVSVPVMDRLLRGIAPASKKY